MTFEQTSGLHRLNYVIYWDIFRDYLIEGARPPDPLGQNLSTPLPLTGVQLVAHHGTTSAKRVAESLEGLERGWVNVMSDLAATAGAGPRCRR